MSATEVYTLPSLTCDHRPVGVCDPVRDQGLDDGAAAMRWENAPAKGNPGSGVACSYAATVVRG